MKDYYYWAVSIKIIDEQMIKLKSLEDVRRSRHLCESEDVKMYLPYDNVEEASEYLNALGVKHWALGLLDS